MTCLDPPAICGVAPSTFQIPFHSGTCSHSRRTHEASIHLMSDTALEDFKCRWSLDQLSDFPACGFRNEASTVHPFIPGRVQRRDECLWDCDWVDNPFYRDNWTIHLVDNYLKNPDNPDEKVMFEDVKYFMMTPKIPKNLTCLDGCRLQEVVSQNRVICKPTRISKKDYKDL